MIIRLGETLHQGQAARIEGARRMTTVAPDNRVREIRKRQGLSSDALAKMVGTSGATIRRHESGDHRAAVAAECEENLELIESARADAHMYDGDYALRTVADAIKARGNQP
jgi:DNA-binding transcriptional regulator YiaG